MGTFKFEGGLVAEITVSVVDSDGDTIEISGVPTKKDVESFVMCGDFEEPTDNDFINITNPSFSLKWQFE